MLIEYVANGSKREVADGIGQVLIDRRIARAVYQTRNLTPEPVEVVAEISPATGKPKRRYRRRDMAAED